MVIANSDSTSTLVSLDNALKRVSSLEALQVAKTEEVSFRKTDVYLPADAFCFDDTDSCSDEGEVPIYVSEQGSSVGADECLRCLPQVLESCDELLTQGPVHYTRLSKESVLYVGQGEVAHAVSSQCDVIVSDKATTCHILAFHSTTEESSPLVSLAHLDAPNYDSCIRSMIKRHHHHHHHKETNAIHSKTNEKVQLSVHIVGGFEDPNGSSRSISDWLIHLLADIAEVERDWLQMTLRTCAITSMNDSGHSSPIGRGLAVDVRSGIASLAKCDKDVTGPVSSLRSARLWSRDSSPKLSLIHDERSKHLSIEPFCYKPFRGLNSLLSLPDDMLLQYTSTSPDCEEDDFCCSLRSTLTMVRDVPYRRVFGDLCDRPLAYRRVGCSNTWKPVTNHF